MNQNGFLVQNIQQVIPRIIIVMIRVLGSVRMQYKMKQHLEQRFHQKVIL